MSIIPQEALRSVIQGDLSKVKTLLENDKGLANKKFGGGWTLLHHASFRGYKEIAELLINSGADVNSKDSNNWTALHRASSRGLTDIIRVLLFHKALLNIKTNNGDTPISLSVLGRFEDAVRILLEGGSDINLIYENDDTILHHAAEMGKVSIVKLLLNKGTNVNARKRFDVTPLHVAAAYGNEDIVRLLLEKGGNVNIVSEFCGTPFHQAKASNSNEIVNLMLKYGAVDNPRKFPVLKGEYFGMKSPGKTPELFAPGIIKNIHRWVSSPTFSPDGTEVYWSAGTPHGFIEKIWFMKQENGIWCFPKIALFSGKYNDGQPQFSLDGKKLFFHSNRPSENNGPAKNDSDIWMVRKSGNTWGKPLNAGQTVNSDKPENYVSVNNEGTLYFQGMGEGGTDIYLSKSGNNLFLKNERLNTPINSKFPDSNPAIAPDNSYLVFISMRPGGYTAGFNLYVCFRKKDGTWSEAQDLGKIIKMENLSKPKITPDGKYLFFQSNFNIYWVSTEIIELLRPKG